MMRNFIQTWQTNWTKQLNKYVPALVGILVFGSLGAIFLLTSHAATPTATLEVESGTVSSAASSVADSTASGGYAVRFGSSGGTATNNCFPIPSSCGYPDATNTGPAAGTTFTTINGDYTISSPGTYQNLKVLGMLTIDASNVTVKNSIISPPSSEYWAVHIPDGHSNVVIDHSEVNGNSQNTPGVVGSGFELTWCNVHSTADGVDPGSDAILHNNWIHNLYVPPGSHVDGIQSSGGANYVIEHNTIDARGDGVNSAIIWGADLGAISNTMIDDNLLAGGGYTVYAGSAGTYSAGTINILNNRFVRNSWGYGPASFDTAGAPGTINFTGNVYDDTGAPLTL